MQNTSFQIFLLEYDVILDGPYATATGEMYTEKTSIHYTKATSIHYQALSKKDITWKIDVNNLSVWSLQGLLLLFFDKRDDFTKTNEEFYNPNINKILVLINGISLQIYRAGLKIFIESWKNIFIKNTLMWHGKCF